jgi:transcriptional regulator with XRE-family HTH domain
MANTTGRTLGELLREARTAADLSLRDLAKKLSISPSYISDIENDRRVPSEEVLRDLANTFGLSFDDLMAMAGRVGDQTERYLRHHPTAGILFRRISDKHLPEKDLQQLVNAVEQMGKKKNPP